MMLRSSEPSTRTISSRRQTTKGSTHYKEAPLTTTVKTSRSIWNMPEKPNVIELEQRQSRDESWPRTSSTDSIWNVKRTKQRRTLPRRITLRCKKLLKNCLNCRFRKNSGQNRKKETFLRKSISKTSISKSQRIEGLTQSVEEGKRCIIIIVLIKERVRFIIWGISRWVPEIESSGRVTSTLGWRRRIWTMLHNSSSSSKVIIRRNIRTEVRGVEGWSVRRRMVSLNKSSLEEGLNIRIKRYLITSHLLNMILTLLEEKDQV